MHKCKGNEKEYHKLYYQENKDKWSDPEKRFAKRHPEKNRQCQKAYKERNKEKVKAYNKAWAQRNSGKVTAYARAYQLAKSRNAPAWLTKEQLEAIESTYVNRPDGSHVDHIIPLRGKIVSGLHVPWNLQYLRAAENIKKSNKI